MGGFGLVAAGLALASLLHGFEWSIYNQKTEDIDMGKELGLTTTRVIDLIVITTFRFPLHICQGEHYGMQNGFAHGH